MDPLMGNSQDLVSAASIGDYGTVDRILSNNIEDVNAVNSSGWTAVMYAANFGHFNIIRLLVRYNCDVNFQDSTGRSALMMAACNGHTRCIDALINYGKADKTMVDASGANALTYANNNGHGSNKLIKSLLINDKQLVDQQPGVQRYQVKGRSYSQMKSDLRDRENRIKMSANSQESDQMFNPCRKTPFSNANWGSVDSIDSDLNPTAQQFVPSNHWPQSTDNNYLNGLTPTPPSSSFSSSLSSQSSSVISAPPNFRRKVIGKKQRRKSYKSPVIATSAPMPKTLFHLLTRIDLIQYLDVFENNGIDFKQFLTLTDEDLQRLGIACFGHRKKLAIAQQRYHESLDITNTNESFLADFLLNERVVLNDKIQALEERVKDLEKIQ